MWHGRTWPLHLHLALCPAGAKFSATDSAASGLSVAPPEAFGFLRPNPAGIAVTGRDIELRNGGSISSESFGQGYGGEIRIHADRRLVANAGAVVAISSYEVGEHCNGNSTREAF